MTIAYFIDQLTALWAMALNQEGWQSRFDRTVDGVLKSFWLIIPALLITMAIMYVVSPALRDMAERQAETLVLVPRVPAFFAKSVQFLLEWFGGLGMLILAANRLGYREQASDIILSYNWMRMMVAILFAVPPLVLALTRFEPLLPLIVLPVIVASIVLIWGVLRRALPQCDMAIIAALMIGLLFINIVTQTIYQLIVSPFSFTA